MIVKCNFYGYESQHSVHRLINGQLQPERSQAEPRLLWCVPTEIVYFEWQIQISRGFWSPWLLQK
jgi:hypothetical protein